VDDRGLVLPADFFERLARPPGSDDPHRHLEALRVDPPPRLRSGELVLARHRDVVAVLRDPAFVKPPLPSIPLPSVRATMRNFLLLDGPDHVRLRRVVAPLFTTTAVERRRARIEERAAALLDGRRELEVIDELAYPLPLRMIADALGVRPGDEARIAAWGAALLETLDNPMPLSARGAARMAKAVVLRRSHPVRLLRAIQGIAGYARGRLLDGGAPPEADVLRTLQVALRDGTITLDEAIGTWILVVIAGHETTANIIGTALHLLLAHPDQHRLVEDDPTLLGSAVREALRLESPVPAGARQASTETSVAGVDVPAGTTVQVLFGAANRDPAVFEHPDRYDLLRSETAHVAFGHGSHFCVGAQLAQLEAEVAVGTVLRRRSHLAAGARPTWRPTFATGGGSPRCPSCSIAEGQAGAARPVAWR
jgi:cytochrome P450